MAKTYWLPRHTQRYYYYNLAYEMVTINYWHGSSDDLGRYWLGNIHQTLEQATTYARNFAGAFGLPSEFDGGQGDASA